MQNKRIAILFAGMPRFYEECSGSILNFFDTKEWDVDFFIHSWTNCWLNKYRQKEELVLNHDKNLLEDNLSTIYKPKSILVEDQLKCEEILNSYDLFKKAILLTDKNFQSLFAKENWRYKFEDISYFLNNLNAGQLYSIGKASTMRAEYELENDFKYDLVIRYRLDNILEPNKKLEKYLDKIYKTITNPQNPYPNNPVNCVGACTVNWVMIIKNQLHVGDRMFASDSEGFDVFNNLLGYQMRRVLKYICANSDDHFFSCPEACIGSLIQDRGFLAAKCFDVNIINYRESFKELEDQSWESLIKHWNKNKLWL